MDILSQGQIGRLHKEALAPILDKYEKMEVIRIIKDYHLLPNGHVKEENDITFMYSGEEPLTVFPWHIVFATEETKIIGTRVQPGPRVIGFKCSEKDKFHLIEIRLDDLRKGEFIHLQFEYFTTGASYFQKKILHNKIHYPMAFVPADTVESLDIRVHIPGNKLPESDINLTQFFVVHIENEQVLLTSQEENLVGDISGYITVVYRNSFFQTIMSIIIGIILSVTLVIIPEFRPILDYWWFIIIPILMIAAIYLSYRLIKE